MPCSAPCDRLPCDERCNKLLPCGHQCPSICGETCPVDCCQQCGTKLEEQPDMIMMTPYADLDLNESPIIVLSCGHFFTTETLDGHVGLRDVYTQDPMTGRFTSLIENAELAVSVPQCPHCRGPIKQYVTQRYNRVINRAVIDEMSKRFIVNGQQELQQMAEILSKVESDLNKSRNILLPAFPIYLDNEEVSNTVVRGMSREIAGRYKELVLLLNDIKAIQIRMAMHHQPASKLHQAILYGMSHNSSLDFVMDKLSIDSSAASVKRSGDLRVTLGAQLLEIKIQALLLEDEFDIADRVQSKCPNSTISLRFWDGAPAEKTNAFLESCKQLMEDCIAATLPKIAVETALHYARIVQLFGSSGLADDEAQLRAKPYRNTANELLQKAEQLCEHKFRDRDTLLKAIVRATKMMSREFYEAVSKEELEAIKNAMVSGQGGIATHSGHWYNCVNGHPVCVTFDIFIFWTSLTRLSLPLASAVCPWSRLAVLNAAKLLVVVITPRLMVLRVLRIWRIRLGHDGEVVADWGFSEGVQRAMDRNEVNGIRSFIQLIPMTRYARLFPVEVSAHNLCQMQFGGNKFRLIAPQREDFYCIARMWPFVCQNRHTQLGAGRACEKWCGLISMTGNT